MEDEAQEMLDDSGFGDWEIVDDAVIVCPCGNSIEWDGECDECGPSPIRLMGMI